MTKKSIVLDLDGVIANIGSCIENYMDKRDWFGSGKKDYSPWLITDCDDDFAMLMFNDPVFWKNMKPYEDSWHQINYWFSEDIDIHIVTARRCEAAMKATQPWLDFWRINTMVPIFTNINEKHFEIEKLNPDFVVEDNPHEVAILIKHGFKAVLRKQWYNEPYWDTLPTIDTLYDLDWN